MTVPCLAEPAPAGDLDAAIDALRDRGLRLSASRRLVLEALFAAGRPATAEEIASGMYGRLPRCDLASVYRNLETLEELGLVRHMHLGHGPGLYAPAADDDEYVACERCGRSEAVSRDVLAHVRAAVREAVGYEPRFSHFPLTGLCPSCKEKLDVRTR
jgi:Fur family transcriptional regulator, ferric uptake regulator